jgi:integrase
VTNRRRFGRVRRLPSGRWQARHPGPDGVDRAAPRTFLTKTDAQRWLSSVETDQARGSWCDPTKGAITLSSYANTWLSTRTVKGRPLAPKTLHSYRGSLDRHILPALGRLPIAKITPEVVRIWHADLGKRTATEAAQRAEAASAANLVEASAAKTWGDRAASPRPVTERTGQTATRQAYSTLRAILSTAVEDGALARQPCTVRGAGQATSLERPLIGLEDAQRLADGLPAHLRALGLLAFWGGLRLGELRGLRRGDVDLDGGTVRVARQLLDLPGGQLEAEPKRGSLRTVHLSLVALDALREHLAAAGPGLPSARLFTHRDGSDLREHHVESAWRVARLKVGLPGVHLHDLRHAGLTLAAQSGATLAEVMSRAGHVSPQAALTYQHAAERRDADVAAKMGAAASVGGDPIRTGT